MLIQLTQEGIFTINNSMFVIDGDFNKILEVDKEILFMLDMKNGIHYYSDFVFNHHHQDCIREHWNCFVPCFNLYNEEDYSSYMNDFYSALMKTYKFSIEGSGLSVTLYRQFHANKEKLSNQPFFESFCEAVEAVFNHM